MVKPSPEYRVEFYTKETFMDFHRLLLGCLTLYATTLRKIKQRISKLRRKGKSTSTILHTDPEPKSMEDEIVYLFICLESYNRLLLLIMSSHSYATHLRLLASTQVLLPSIKDVGHYNTFKSNLLSGPGIDELLGEPDDDKPRAEEEVGTGIT